ncbi:hypothetical protein K474DRAFT_1516753 [Panus rudis PR-1116 ss-1]|nr:hypothetical protein K474DRAFT_1516753 [Panus rudis PR-1116 ss-1]
MFAVNPVTSDWNLRARMMNGRAGTIFIGIASWMVFGIQFISKPSAPNILGVNMYRVVRMPISCANTQGEKQWRLLRDHVLQESIQHDNDTRRIILGIYIIYDSQMISFVPIGRIHQINMKYDQFAQDASKATNAFVHSLAVLASPSDCTTDVLFQQDKVMDKLAEALRLNKLQPEDVGMSVEGEILS